MNKTWILLLTHGEWGKALLESTSMITGEMQAIECYPLMPLDAIKDYSERIEKRTLAQNRNAILIADLFGGTTANVAMYMAKKYGVPALSGLSMPMLVAADMWRNQMQGEALVKEILKTVTGNNRNLTEIVKNV